MVAIAMGAGLILLARDKVRKTKDSQEHLGHQNSGVPPFFGVIFLYYEPVYAGDALIKSGIIGDTLRLLQKRKENQNPDAGP